MAPPLLLSQVASGIGVLFGAFVAKSLLDSSDPTSLLPPNNSFSLRPPPCPTCNGSRRVPCLCSRWSDGDVGCNACSGSGKAVCNSCGGSGTGRPIPVTIKSYNK